ncbi:hypothetical protein J6590_085316 [Homalodisca vitripennis]|nr:hypothetical protein J6590_085316 [Homalodisca vitripennis]
MLQFPLVLPEADPAGGCPVTIFKGQSSDNTKSPGTIVLMLQFPLVQPEADHLLVAVRIHWCCLRLITCWWLSGNDTQGTKFRQYEISRTVMLMLQFPLVLPEADHLLVAVR